MNFIFFENINQFFERQLSIFVDAGLLRMLSFMQSFMEVLLVTWIMWQGYRIITGRSRDSLNGFIWDMARVVIVIAFAHSLTVGNATIRDWLNGLSQDIANVFSLSGPTTIYKAIDQSLLTMQETINGLSKYNSNAKAGELNSMTWFSMFGQGFPVLIMGVLLTLNKITLALVVVFAPLFVMALAFESTYAFFWHWLKTAIGTIFAWSVLLVLSMLALKVVDAYAKPLLALLTTEGDAADAPSLMNTAILQAGLGVLVAVVLVFLYWVTLRFFSATVNPVLSRVASQNYPVLSFPPTSTPPMSVGVVGSSSPTVNVTGATGYGSAGLPSTQNIRLTGSIAPITQRIVVDGVGMGMRGNAHERGIILQNNTRNLGLKATSAKGQKNKQDVDQDEVMRRQASDED